MAQNYIWTESHIFHSQLKHFLATYCNTFHACTALILGNEVRKDNQILNAKVKYLESSKDSKAIDDFLTLLREICPKPTF